MKEKILVTGANGHLGANTIRALLKRDYQVKAFVRKDSNVSGLEGLPVEYSYGDVQNGHSLLEASKNCDAIIHHAAVYKYWSRTVEEIIAPAVEGTENIFKAAHENGIKRMVYTSSIYAIGTSNDPQKVLTVKDWNLNSRVPYGIAKAKSEELAWELSTKYNIPMISLCPGAIFGRYDYRVTPSNRFILDMIKGLGMTMETTISFVDARDAGELHALAIDKGKVGNRYVVTSEALRMKTLGDMVHQLTGKKIPHSSLGRSFNIGMAKAIEVVANISDWDPPLTAGVMKEYSHRYAQYDNSKTIKDFDYRFRSLESSVRDTIKWFAYLYPDKLNKKIRNEFQPEPEWNEKTTVRKLQPQA